MKARGAPAGPHPSASSLALHARGDLTALSSWQIKRHLRRCGECERQVDLFRLSTAELKRDASSQTLTAYEAVADWDRLEREMIGNIAVGVAAARCIDNVGGGRSLLVRGSLAGALVALFVAGWMTHISKDETERLASTLQHLVGFHAPPVMGTMVRTTPGGIAVHAQGATLTIMHPASAVVSVSGDTAVTARYVDEDTGQVTITNVYGQ